MMYIFISLQPNIMISANVPSAKKIIVHGPDLTSIPSQFPVHEVTCSSCLIIGSKILR
jgi:hypothetical protein